VVFIDPFGVAGLAHYNYCLCQALAGRGHDVVLLTSSLYHLDDLWPHDFRVEKMVTMWSPFDSQGMPDAGEVLTKVQKGLLYSWGMTKMVARVRSERPDVVHLSESFFALDLVFLAALKTSGAKLVHTCHNVRSFQARGARVTGRGRIGDGIHRLTYRCYDRIIFHAQDNLREYLDVFDGDERKTFVVPHGDYSVLADEGSLSRVAARRRLRLPEQGKMVLFFGIIRRYKGLPDLIRAFSGVRRQVPDAFLVVAGAPFRDSDIESCRQMASEGGISDAVRWHLRYVPENELSPYFMAADLVVLPYRKIYQSGILQLAYAHRRPVVATRVGGLPEAVDDGRTGLLVPPRDPRALASAITRLLSDEGLAERMGEEGYRLAKSSFDWGDIAVKTEAVYLDALRGDT
jgi:D-inositol-3-phosphate glycosyltransferase